MYFYHFFFFFISILYVAVVVFPTSFRSIMWYWNLLENISIGVVNSDLFYEIESKISVWSDHVIILFFARIPF